MKTIETNIAHGVISRRTHGAFSYHGWPTITKLSDGTLAAACSGHRVWHVCPFGKTMLFLSRNDGETWSAPIVVNDTWLDDRDVGLAALPNNGLLLSWFTADYTLLDVRAETLAKIYSPGELELVNAYRKTAIQDPNQQPGSHVRVSYDGGLTWGETVTVPVSAPHGPALMNDGSLLYFGKKYGPGMQDIERAVVALRSDDDGKTWEEIGGPTLPENTTWVNFVEPHCIQMPSGRIVGVVRYQFRNNAVLPQPPLEKYGSFSMFITFSDDGGKTWSDMEWIENSVGAPPHLMRHSSGALLLSHGRRAKGDESERVWVSWDEGKTWALDICISHNAPDGDLGYASTVELSDGTMLTAYYEKFVENGVPDKRTSFLWTKWKFPGDEDAPHTER